MSNHRCLKCIELKRCKDSCSAWVFFIIGLIATIAMRVVTVLMHLNPVYGKIAWYIGIAGFFMFFMYKFKITQARSKLIKQRNLIDKIDKRNELEDEDYQLISGILCSLSSKKERINYLFIFVLSAFALVIAVYIDIFK